MSHIYENDTKPILSNPPYLLQFIFEQPLLDLGWDVIVFVPSKEEDSDRITCGNALISEV